MDIAGELSLVRHASTTLLADLRGVDGVTLDGPSRVEGLTRRQVVAGLVADAWAKAGEDPPSPSDDIVADLVNACEHLADSWAVRSPDAWGRRLDGMRRGNSRAASEPAARLTKISLGHVDLDIGFEPASWLEPVVDVCLDHAMASLARQHARVRGEAAAWRLHRTDTPAPSGDAPPAATDWMVIRAPYGTEIHPVAGDADATISAPGSALLAWVTGRIGADAPDLAVAGDAALAALLPSTYPYDG